MEACDGMCCSSTNLYTRGLEGSFLELSQLLKPHEAPKGDTPVVPTKHNVPWNGDGFEPFVPLWGKWTSTSPDMKNQPIFFLWTRGSKNDEPWVKLGPFCIPWVAQGIPKESDRRREFGSQVARDVAVWMVLAFATAQTDLGPLGRQSWTFSVPKNRGVLKMEDPRDHRFQYWFGVSPILGNLHLAYILSGNQK